MSSVLYGRLTGRTGKQQTVMGSKSHPVIAQVETREAALKVTLHPDGLAYMEFGTKQHDKDAAPRFHALHTVDLNDVEGIKHYVHQPHRSQAE